VYHCFCRMLRQGDGREKMKYSRFNGLCQDFLLITYTCLIGGLNGNCIVNVTSHSQTKEKKMRTKHIFLIFLFILVSTSQAVIYVDQDATGFNSGKSWTNAYVDLQDALEEAFFSPDDIWVAEGTYYPIYQTNPLEFRSVAFRLINGVSIYGGFDPDAGVTEFKSRKPSIYICTLSGDIGIKGNNTDNCYHILYHPDTISVNNTAILDGFIIKNGNANGTSHYGSGGAVYNNDNSPGFINCTFESNTANNDGGAVYNTNGSNPGFLNCTFYYNIATSISNGGAICNINSDPTLNGCVFDELYTTADNSAYFGGGIYNSDSNPYITNCEFYECDAESGAAIYNDNSSPTIYNCTFQYNRASGAAFNCRGGAIANINNSNPMVTGGLLYFNIAFGESFGKGGGIYCDATSVPHISGTMFESNISWDNGGGIYCDGTSPMIDDNAVFSGNSANLGGAIYCTNSFGISVTNVTFEENVAHENGGAMYFNNSTPSIVDCNIISNESQWSGAGLAFINGSGGTVSNCNIESNMTTIANQMGGGIYCNLSSPTITDTTITGNTTKIGGGIACELNASPTLTNCRIINNTAAYDAGGLFAVDSCAPTLINCIVADNQTLGDSPGYGQGGAMYLANDSSATLKNCTIANNTADASTGGIYTFVATVSLTNCIVWSNSGTQLNLDTDSSATYCDVQGGYTGTGNIDQNPLFIYEVTGNYHLQQTSPCVDTASNTAASGITTDIDGDDRIIDGDGDATDTVDMGADEAPEIPSTVWVDDDYTPGGANDGHAWGYDAFNIIQDGINAVATGGTVNVAAGTYVENITLNKELALDGSGPWQTTIDGNDDGSVIAAFDVTDNTTITGFTITNGSGTDLGGSLIVGGGIFLNNSDLILAHCIITDNTAIYGGGIDNENTASPTVVNCLFTNNTASYGGVVDNFSNCNPEFINCTFAQNTATTNGDAFYNENNCSPTVTNCILWDNSVNEIYNDAGSSITITYSNIRGSWPGTANLDTDPLFLDLSGRNFRLPHSSPCVENGSNAAVMVTGFTDDLDNTTRIDADNCIYPPIVDRGAYELNLQRIGDFNNDCAVNLIDFSIFAADWLSNEYQSDIAPPYADGIVDTDDLKYFVEHWLEVYN